MSGAPSLRCFGAYRACDFVDESGRHIVVLENAADQYAWQKSRCAESSEQCAGVRCKAGASIDPEAGRIAVSTGPLVSTGAAHGGRAWLDTIVGRLGRDVGAGFLWAPDLFRSGSDDTGYRTYFVLGKPEPNEARKADGPYSCKVRYDPAVRSTQRTAVPRYGFSTPFIHQLFVFWRKCKWPLLLPALFLYMRSAIFWQKCKWPLLLPALFLYMRSAIYLAEMQMAAAAPSSLPVYALCEGCAAWGRPKS
eukprot:4614802-Prymnesium_polylepis.1